MEAARWAEVRAILESVVDRPAAERQRYLLDACRDDPELLAEVNSFLSADAAAEYLDYPMEFPRDPWPGRRLGSWLLVRRLGQGGMGAVYEATRADRAYDQRAAIKLVSAAVLSQESARRFWNERQVLARLAHPNIARLLDGGGTDEGVPYLVMEYVDGLPIEVKPRGLSPSGDSGRGLRLVTVPPPRLEPCIKFPPTG